MKQILIGLLTLLFVTLMPVSAEDNVKLEIIYPKNNSTINASSVNIVGNTKPDANLIINNTNVKVYSNGAFVQVLKLDRGINTINIKATKGHAEKEIQYKINVPEYEQTIPSYPLKIQKSSITPAKNILYQANDTVIVSFKGSTGLKASFSIGKNCKNIPMNEQPPKKLYADPVYGKAEAISPMPVKGIYKGFYKIKSDDNFNNETIKIELVSDKETLSEEAAGKISVIPDCKPPITAEIIKDYAVTRNAPNQSRLTPLPKTTLLNITGKIGNDYRFKYSDSMDGWISESDIKVLPAGKTLSQNTINLFNVNSDRNFVYLSIPLAQKLPFIIDQVSENQMNLKLFGTNLNIDLFSYNNTGDFIKELKWIQESNDCLKLTIKINAKQFWGYKYYYEGDNLVIRLKKPPEINNLSPLKDKIICIDAGHGGTEPGAIGPTKIPEKLINFEISDKLKKILEKKGAKVIMARNSDKAVGLFDRVNKANSGNADILISIHNNSLPDGRNPFEEHGSSTYYYHSQSLPLAKNIQKSLVKTAELKDLGVFYSSFVLTRPTEELAVLVEVGFMINPEEYNLLITPEFQAKAAEGIAHGLENFFLSQIENTAK